ncbi:MAG: MmgE/PrpD family protein, partial [Hyphomicrobiales bacterium]
TAEGIVHRLWEPLDLKQKPPTSYAAKFSVPFGVALGLVRHQAALEDFTTASINDPELLAIASKVDFEIDPDNPYPAAFTGHIRIEYADGTIIEEEQDHMRGGAKEPLTRQEINDKFRANLRFGQITDTESILDVCDRIAAGDDDTTLLREFAQA